MNVKNKFKHFPTSKSVYGFVGSIFHDNESFCAHEEQTKHLHQTVKTSREIIILLVRSYDEILLMFLFCV